MPDSAVDILRKLIEGVGEERWEGLAALYAKDAVIEQPLGLPERTRLVGRAAIADHFASASALPIRLRPDNVVIHSGLDPEIAVAEFDYVLENSAGEQVRTANVQVARVRDGLIVYSRDYHDHARIAAVLGRLTAIAGAFSP